MDHFQTTCDAIEARAGGVAKVVVGSIGAAVAGAAAVTNPEPVTKVLSGAAALKLYDWTMEGWHQMVYGADAPNAPPPATLANGVGQVAQQLGADPQTAQAIAATYDNTVSALAVIGAVRSLAQLARGYLWEAAPAAPTSPAEVERQLAANANCPSSIQTGVRSAPRTPGDILTPGGSPVGRPGASGGIRRLNGGLDAAEKMFNDLAAGGKDITPPGYPGKLVELPGGGRVGLRPVSSSADKSPSIDINIPGIPVKKIHFEP